jgi:DNA damage-binding protein 1
MKFPRQPEISAISCTPLDPTKPFSKYTLVSYWDSHTIEVLATTKSGFESVYKSLPLPSLVSSLLFYNFGSDQSSKKSDYHPYLLAGLSDGSVATFAWQDNQLKDRKVISLGHAPVNLVMCRVHLEPSGTGSSRDGQVSKESGRGVKTVLAAGNRAIVFSHERNRLVYSPILLKVCPSIRRSRMGKADDLTQNIVAASPLNIASLQSSLIIASEEGLHIGKIKDLNKLHIRSVSFIKWRGSELLMANRI